jgi:hypothetical protein
MSITVTDLRCTSRSTLDPSAAKSSSVRGHRALTVSAQIESDNAAAVRQVSQLWSEIRAVFERAVNEHYWRSADTGKLVDNRQLATWATALGHTDNPSSSHHRQRRFAGVEALHKTAKTVNRTSGSYSSLRLPFVPGTRLGVYELLPRSAKAGRGLSCARHDAPSPGGDQGPPCRVRRTLGLEERPT